MGKKFLLASLCFIMSATALLPLRAMSAKRIGNIKVYVQRPNSVSPDQFYREYEIFDDGTACLTNDVTRTKYVSYSTDTLYRMESTIEWEARTWKVTSIKSDALAYYNANAVDNSEHKQYTIKKIIFSNYLEEVPDGFYSASGFYLLHTAVLPEGLKRIGKGAFLGIKNVNIPSTLEIIDESALVGMERRSLEIPDNVKYIGRGAFAGSAMEEVILPEGITLAEEMFRNCSNLSKVNLPKDVKEIPASIFDGCKNLSITIPQGVTHIGDKAFAGCDLGNVSLPQLTHLGSEAFAGSNIMNLSAPSLSSVGESAFARCSMLEAISLPALKEMGKEVFNQCGSLRSAAFGNALKRIPERTFMECTALKEVDMGGSVEVIANNAFVDCPALERINIPGSVVNIGEPVSGYEYDKGAAPFGGCLNLKEINVAEGENPLIVQPFCFGYGDAPVERIHIGRDVTFLHPSESADPTPTFSSALKKVSVGENVKSILGGMIFHTDSKVEIISMSKLPPEIDWLTSSMAVETPKGCSPDYLLDGKWASARTIFSRASDGSKLYPVLFQPSGDPFATINGEQSYRGELPEGELIRIALADATADTKGMLFRNGVSITRDIQDRGYVDFKVSENVAENLFTSIGGERFYAEVSLYGTPLDRKIDTERASLLTALIVKGDVTADDFEYIRTMPELRVLDISGAYFTGDRPMKLAGCPRLEVLICPVDVSSIPSGFCKGMATLRSVEFPAGLKTIGSEAFSGCISLSEVTIPGSVTEIGYQAFSGCGTIRLLNFESTGASGAVSVFNDSFMNCHMSTIRVNRNIVMGNDSWVDVDDRILFRSIGDLRIGPDVNSIDIRLFGNGKSTLSSLVIEDGVTTINLGSFSSDFPLSEIYIGRIPADRLFPNGNTTIKKVTFGEEITRIPATLLSQGEAIEEIEIKGRITEIGQDAFCMLPALKSFTMPSSLRKLEKGTFRNNTGLEKVYWEEGYDYPEIEQGMFYRCLSLKEIEIPECTEAIGEYAFRACPLEDVVIPANVTLIQRGAFKDCPVKKVVCKAPVPPTVEGYFVNMDGGWDYIFDNINMSKAVLYVPVGSKKLYKEHRAFNEFRLILEEGEQMPSSVTDIPASSENQEHGMTEVYTLDGRLVKSVIADDDALSDIEPGIYIIRQPDGKVRKIMKK